MSEYAGTGALTRLALRRDRVLLPVWIAVFVLTVASTASATLGLYPTAAARAEAAAAVNDIPAFVAWYGRVWDPTSLGALSIMKLGAFGAAMVGLLAALLVVRHTRAEEEAGRLELLGSTVVGRKAALTAALLAVGLGMLALGVLAALAQIAAGLPVAGSWAFGLSWALCGLAFAGVAAITAQLTVSARAASAWAAVVLVAAYLLRALGDVAGDAAEPAFWSWLSPIGWAEQVRPYAGDRWWALLPPIAFTAAAVWLAYALAARRDLGAGLLPDRVGPARAGARLASPLALAWRLQRGVLAGWAVAFALLGAIFGSIATNLGDLLDSEAVQELFQRLGGTDVLTDAFVATEMGFVALFAAAYGVSASMRLHSEEQSGHAEVLLAGAVSRRRWLGSHVAVAALGATLLCLVAGASAGISYGLSSGSLGKAASVVAGLVAYLPAIWVMTALVVWLFGWLPRLVVLGWGALVAAVLVGELGLLLDLPQWVMDLSPFTHVPRIPGEDWTWGGWLAVLAVAIGLAAWGAAGFRRRDLDTP